MGEELPNPHDRFFKELVSRPEGVVEIARQALPPTVFTLLDLTKLQRMEDTWIDPELRSHFADAVYRVGLTEPDDRSAFLYVLFEHKSHPEPFVALQVLRYMVQGWLQNLKADQPHLSVIIPLVLYHGRSEWRVAKSYEALFGTTPAVLSPYIPRFEYVLLDRSAGTPLEDPGEVPVRVALALMQLIFRDDWRVLLPWILKGLPLGIPGMLQWLETMLIYVQSARQIPEKELAESLQAAFPEAGGKKVLKFIEEWRNEGRVEGVLETVQRQLRRKFGSAVVTEHLVGRLQALSLTDLELLAEDILDLATPADLLEWLDCHQK